MDDDFDGKTFGQRFIEANANNEFIASYVAQVLRDLMRAAVAVDRSRQLFNASRNVDFIIKLVKAAREPLDIHQILESALSEFDPRDERSEHRTALVDAACAGVRFYVERSCHDNAAEGRSEQRAVTFKHAMEEWKDAWDNRGLNRQVQSDRGV